MSNSGRDKNPLSLQPVDRLVVVTYIAACVALLGICGSIYSSALEVVRRSVNPPARCSNNLRMIGLALQSYHAAQGCFPPAYVLDGKSRPMHSWRALILPYLDDQELSEEYDFNQPWDSPHNLALFDKMPKWYRCPSAPWDQPLGQTNYVAIVGPHTLFPGEKVRRESDVVDRLSKTIAVIERGGPGVNWLQPVDLPADELLSDPLAAIRPPHNGRTKALFADASVHFLSEPLLQSPTLNAMITIDGREPAAQYKLNVED